MTHSVTAISGAAREGARLFAAPAEILLKESFINLSATAMRGGALFRQLNGTYIAAADFLERPLLE